MLREDGLGQLKDYNKSFYEEMFEIKFLFNLIFFFETSKFPVQTIFPNQREKTSLKVTTTRLFSTWSHIFQKNERNGLKDWVILTVAAAAAALAVL